MSATAVSKAQEIGGTTRVVTRPKKSPSRKRHMKTREESKEKTSESDSNIMARLTGVTQVIML